MPSSPARIAANRRNAARSTGPRTAHGKARARLNALRHGARASDATLLALDAASVTPTPETPPPASHIASTPLPPSNTAADTSVSGGVAPVSGVPAHAAADPSPAATGTPLPFRG